MAEATQVRPPRLESLKPASDRGIWPGLTVALLFAGYASLYFCRSNLALAKDSIAAEFAPFGITIDSISRIAAIGVFVYSVGKLLNGTLGDFIGGRAVFLISMFGSSACTILFLFAPQLAVGSESQWLLVLFIVFFGLNRFVQSAGWGGLVKIASQWFGYQSYGRVMSILCMSYLFGDFLARQILSMTLGEGGGWRLMFMTATSILTVVAILNVFLLRESPQDVGLPKPEASPRNLYGSRGNVERPDSIWDVIGPYVLSPAFWTVLFLSTTLTYVRESSNFFNNDYLQVAVGVSREKAAAYSSYFPLFGAIAVFFSGFMTDRFARGKRGLLMAILLAALVPVLFAMAYIPRIQGTIWPVVLSCAVGFLALAPYAFLSGAISMDLGGKRGSSTAAGIIDAVGYALGGVAGMEIKKFLVHSQDLVGWRPFFLVMAILMALSSIAAVAYWYLQERDVLQQGDE